MDQCSWHRGKGSKEKIGRALDGVSGLARAGCVEGECKGPHRHGILAESGERDLRDRVERVHHIPRETSGDGVPQRRPDQGETAAYDDDLRMKEMHRMGEGEGQVVGQLAQDGLGDRVVVGQGWTQESGFTPLGIPHVSGQWTFGMEEHGVANPSIHGPTGTALLDDGAGLVQAEVSEFGLSWDGAVVDVTADDESTSDPAAHVDPEDRIVVGAGPMTGFTEGGHVRVVVDRDGKTGQSMKPLAEFELMPALDLV